LARQNNENQTSKDAQLLDSLHTQIFFPRFATFGTNPGTMRHLSLFTTSLLVLIMSACSNKAQDQKEKTALDHVNPFIGTGGHGHTYPGATLPFGMVQLSPDTRLEGWDGCSAYHYSDSIVYGFSHTHLSGTGVSDYGDILLMPCVGDVRFANGYRGGVNQGYASRFSKNTEHASPGYYAVHLDDYNIGVELTATERAGMHHYAIPNTDFHIIIDLEHRDPLISHSLQQSGPAEVSGHRISKAWAEAQHVYFVAQFSAPIKAYVPSLTPVIRQGSAGLNGKNEYSKVATKAAIHFEATKDIVVKVGISAVSIENARQNLEAEMPDFNFDLVHSKAREAWRKQLDKIEVHGKNQDDKAIFYSALYHTMLAPNLFNDSNGEYRGMDGEVHHADHRVYTVFSLWDTFRALHPLFGIIEQERSRDFMRTFLLHHAQGGRLPVWELAGNETDCMIGYHSIPTVLDAYVKGITDFDTAAMLKAMIKVSQMNHFGLESYQRQGFISSSDEPESVSKTLEYAYDDWCIAQFAKALGDSATHATYMQRAQYYKNLFDPGTGFFRARMDGGWFGPFDPAEVNFNYTEANAWQYAMFAPHDIEGLINLHGSKEALEVKLDALFSASSETSGREQADITGLIGQYAHGNEPSHHMAYLYNYTGSPWKTQQYVRQIMDELYTNAPDGLSGNEDCGQMSAWYVMSAMGLYPVTPGLPAYDIGSPRFDSIVLNLTNGKTFTIHADGNEPGHPYIQKAMLNDETYNNDYLLHSTIMDGGQLYFEMGAQPNREWASQIDEKPRSQIEVASLPTVPFYESKSATFTDSVTISISSVNKEATLIYRLDDGTAQPYTAPIKLVKTGKLEAWAVLPNGEKSKSTSNTWYRIDGKRSIALNARFANQYSASGDAALIDHLRGSNNYQTGRWQGYQGQDFEAIVDLGEVQQVDSAGIGFLQDIKSWIWLPPYVEFEISDDGSNWIFARKALHRIPDTAYGSFTHDFMIPINRNTRHIRIKAPNYGNCPEWHMGAGGASWLMSDEILLK
jgi:predicted alpha-1,2-mannosidase